MTDRSNATSAGTATDAELAAIDETELVAEAARELLGGAPPPTVLRVATQAPDPVVSGLRWGSQNPRVVFLHGGGQNAHTWDSVALLLGVPTLALDLPGHGRSGWRDDRDYTPWANAETIAPVLRRWAPHAELVVGMSLGGLTAIRLSWIAPELVRRLVVVDVTPGVARRVPRLNTAERGTIALPTGPRTFPDFATMFAATVAAAPHRDPAVLRRGVLHNSRRLPDGQWTWRYDALSEMGNFGPLWDDVEACRGPVTLVRGGASAFVGEDDVAEFRRRAPHGEVHVVDGAGHSVQSDRPHQLAELLAAALD